ncbi:ABC transporter permease subunit [Fluoribacter dumoffii]|uniref:ABC transporter permease subunit n=1 Tax=Fluoribacter dumoffii TaxID=463 RepID=UPI00026C7B51|nr:ABC transporter permease subunit [Fluoribacter dumoffii]MCW8416732.1 ABC transporter permease subunit [Fluoribacter dumoffii]MCW8455428.1 ABC transporter permease subunit [Fluoribacter dumoffii]MCW8460494.1 ABC transporter permease subunit [Fluoribacter dumoffii]MCW8483975.1 ABC transporter permease subunit [Fluoribacter dumoffii]
MNNLLKRFFLFFVYASLYVPIAVLILYSFNEAKFSLQWKGFSLQWYNELFQDRGLWAAFLNSIILGLGSAFIATIMGLLASIHLFLFRSKHRKILFSILLSLIIIPDLVLGVALLIFFNMSKTPIGFISLLIAHISFCIPFVIVTINARINTLNPNIYFGALDLGASRYIALTRVLLPLLWPAVLSVFLLSFTLSFDDVIISYFVAGPEFNILPLTIYSLVRAGVTPELNALCSITFVLSMILVIISHRLSGKQV